MQQRYLVRVLVSVIIRRHDDIVLIEEKENDRVFYSEPGGHVEKNESLINAAIREAREETGCTVRQLQLFGVYHVRHVHPKISDSLRFVYLVMADENELLHSSEPNIRPFWCPLADLPRYWPDITRAASQASLSAYCAREGIHLPNMASSQDTVQVVYQLS